MAASQRRYRTRAIRVDDRPLRNTHDYHAAIMVYIGPDTQLAMIRAALLDLAERLEKPVTGMSNGDMAKEIRRIAG